MLELLDVGLPGISRAFMSWPRSRLVGYGVSAYLVGDLLIDTGFPGARRDLERLLHERRPRGVILTHEHEDHAGNLDLVAALGIPVATSPATLAALRRPQRIGFYRRFVWRGMQPFTGTISQLEEHGLELIHTPGHSADHHVVWDAERRILYAGDLFLGVKVRVARPGENPRQLVRSLRRAAALQPKVMLDAHRGRIDDPVPALLAKAEWIEQAIAAIDARLAAGFSLTRISRDVLGREDLLSLFTGGDLSRLNFVHAVAASRQGSSPAVPDRFE